MTMAASLFRNTGGPVLHGCSEPLLAQGYVSAPCYVRLGAVVKTVDIPMEGDLVLSLGGPDDIHDDDFVDLECC